MSIVTNLTKFLEKTLSVFPILINIYGLYYKNIVCKEIILGCISCKDKVLCIGGGPLPCTALEIARNTGAQVIVIDNDPKAVMIAKKIISKLDMSDKVKVMHADGQQINPSGFSVIHLANQACPRNKILYNIWQKAPRGTRILMRNPHQSLKFLYKMSSDDCLPEGLYKYIKQKTCTMDSSVVLIKSTGKVKNEKSYTNNRIIVRNRTSMVG